eukprot:363472-Ditylum_brightwellii.AAC.1
MVSDSYLVFDQSASVRDHKGCQQGEGPQQCGSGAGPQPKGSAIVRTPHKRETHTRGPCQIIYVSLFSPCGLGYGLEDLMSEN